MNTVNYGIDAPGIMRNLIFIGVAAIVAGFALPLFFHNVFIKYIGYLIIAVGFIFTRSKVSRMVASDASLKSFGIDFSKRAASGTILLSINPLTIIGQ